MLFQEENEAEFDPVLPGSTTSSTTSGCMSCESGLEDRLLPSSLASEELQLALNKVSKTANLRFITVNAGYCTLLCCRKLRCLCRSLSLE